MARHSEIAVVERSEIHLVGQSVKISLKQVFSTSTVKDMHKEVDRLVGEVRNRVGNETFLMEIYPEGHFDNETPFTTFIGVAVADLSQIPEGLIGHTLAAGRYAKVTHYGPESQLPETYGFVFESGLREAGLGYQKYHYEQWDHRYKQESPDNEIDIYLRVK